MLLLLMKHQRVELIGIETLKLRVIGPRVEGKVFLVREKGGVLGTVIVEVEEIGLVHFFYFIFLGF